MSSLACATSQSRNASSFGRFALALGQTIQYDFDNGTAIGNGLTSRPWMRSHAASVVRASATPWPIGRCIYEHARTIQDRSMKNVRTDDASRVKPLGPGHAIIEVQEWQFEHVAWLLQTRGQRGAANCKQM